ncbi:hypothetical protein G9A89_004131 [Geosiphon pyriformis]|nr:hypothetical protein G9A89_004131 [Geosiphon pyriformis]
MKNGPPPPNTIAGLVYWKNLDDQNDKASGTTCRASHNDVPGRRRTCDEACQYTILINDWVRKKTPIKNAWKRALNRLDGYPHDDHKIWRMASAKTENATTKEIREIKDNPWMPEYIGPDYPEDDFFTDDPDTFRTDIRNWPQLYCDECDLMFNLSLRILFPITELPEPEKEVLITEDMLFQDPIENTKTEQYLTYSDLSKELELKWYSNNKEGICPKRAHDTNADFNLRYPRQLPIIIAPHSLVKIDLKIALEIPVSTMVQVASQSSLAKKEIDTKGGIIDAGYMGNIIVMLQNNSNRPYKIESQEKIA